MGLRVEMNIGFAVAVASVGIGTQASRPGGWGEKPLGISKIGLGAARRVPKYSANRAGRMLRSLIDRISSIPV
jgi:hypothetical protein